MAKYYQIETSQIVIKPLYFLATIGYALIGLFILLPIATALIATGGSLTQIADMKLTAFVLFIPLHLGCIPFFTYSRRQIILDKKAGLVFQKTIFRKTTLMPIAEIGDISSQTHFGIGFYIHKKSDRYGKGTRISPAFANESDKGLQEFRNTVLPAIYAMQKTDNTPTVQDNSVLLLKQDILQYYKVCKNGYILKLIGANKYLPAFIIATLFEIYFLYKYFLNTTQSSQYIFLPLLPILVTLAMLTKKIVIDLEQKKVKLYRFNILMLNYSLADFYNFNIVRKTHNGIYVGTDVRMAFNKINKKSKFEITLADFKKTNPIEPFINETKFVIGQEAREKA